MDDAIKFSMEEKTKAAALKAIVVENEEEARKISEEINSAERRIINNENIMMELEKELNRLKTAIEGIKEITHDLDSLDSEKASGSLKGTLIRKQTDLEKVRGDLISSRKLKDLAARRLAEAEISLQNATKHYSERMTNADLIANNVGNSISQIVQAYSDVMNVARELLMENTGVRSSSQSEVDFKQQSNSGTIESRFQGTKDSKKDEEPLAT
ncbi:MAG: hypothetical protein ACREA1_03740 [Nitrosotalea sp.]